MSHAIRYPMTGAYRAAAELYAGLLAAAASAPDDDSARTLPEWRPADPDDVAELYALAIDRTWRDGRWHVELKAPVQDHASPMMAMHGPERPAGACRALVVFEPEPGARSSFTIKGTRPRLLEMADTVRKNWGRYGGGPKPAELQPAPRIRRASWPAAALKVWREQIECKEWADVLHLGMSALGGRVYQGAGRAAFMVVAPLQVEGLPAEFASARRDDGQWVVYDTVSGRAIGQRGAGSRKAAEEHARGEWERVDRDRRARVVSDARRDETTGADDALAAWCQAHGIGAEPVPADAVPAESEPVADAAPAELAPARQEPPAAVADPAMVAELVASHEASEAGAASLDRLATADSAYAARQPLDTWGRSAYAAQRAADCRAAAAQIRATLADPAPWRGPDNAAARARVHAVHVRTARTAAAVAPTWHADGARMRRSVNAPGFDAASRQLRAAVAAALRAERAAAAADPVPVPVPAVAPADDGGFRARVEKAAAWIGSGRRSARAFDACFEMWDGDAVAAALLERAQRRPDTKLAANLWRYLSREHVERVASERPRGLSLAEWSRQLVARSAPAELPPEPAPPAAPAAAAAPVHPRMAEALALLTAAVEAPPSTTTADTAAVMVDAVVSCDSSPAHLLRRAAQFEARAARWREDIAAEPGDTTEAQGLADSLSLAALHLRQAAAVQTVDLDAAADAAACADDALARVCGDAVADAMAAAPPADLVQTARDGADDRAARLAAQLAGTIGTDPAKLAPALRRESARVAAAAESVPGRMAERYRRTARALADMATAEDARAARERDSLAPDAPRTDPAAPSRQAPAAPPADGWRTIAARPAPAGAFAGLAMLAPGSPCSDIGAAAMLPAAAPAGWRWRPDAPVWRGLQPAGAFPALIGAAGGTRCSDIGADINPAARRGHHVENLECQISQPTPPAAPSSSFRTAWSSRPLSCCVTQQAGRLTSTLHRSWPSVPPAGLTPGCSLTAQKTTPPDCWPRGTRSTWLQVARVMPSWTISSAKRRQKISAAAGSATRRAGRDGRRRTMSTRPTAGAARIRHPAADSGPPRVATSAHRYRAGGAPPARSRAEGLHSHPPRVVAFTHWSRNGNFPYR